VSNHIITVNRLGFTYMKNRNTYVKYSDSIKFVVHMFLGSWKVSSVKNGKDLRLLSSGFKSAKEAMLWQSRLNDRGLYE